ncbi:hypothetical protein FQZ97_1066420 [compost metagenome]
MRLVGRGGHRAEEFGEVGATLGAPHPRLDLGHEAGPDPQARQGGIGGLDLCAVGRRARVGAGRHLLNHLLPVKRHGDVHVVDVPTSGRNAEQQVGAIGRDVAQFPFHIQQPVLAQVGGAGDVAGMEERAFLAHGGFPVCWRNPQGRARRWGRPPPLSGGLLQSMSLWLRAQIMAS